MRILVSTPTFLPLVGGTQLGIHEIYRRIGSHHEVTVMTPYLPKESVTGYRADDYFSENYTVRHMTPTLERVLPYQAKRALKRTSSAYSLELARLIRRDPPDIVNFHYVRPHGAALVALNRLANVPIALSLVGRSDVLGLLPGPQRAYAETVIRHADVVIPNSTYYLKGATFGNQVEVIPYGVDVGEFTPARRSARLRQELSLDDDAFVLFALQRLAPVKRVDLLIRALRDVIVQDPRVVLVIGGRGKEEAKLRELAASLGVAQNVRFAGYIESSRLPEYFASADAFIFHSLVETFGIVFAQAMAAGLPIVAARTSCVDDVLTAENGILVMPFDLRELAEAIVSLAGDRQLARKIGEGNRARAEREFDWSDIARRYEEVFAQLIAAGQA